MKFHIIKFLNLPKPKRPERLPRNCQLESCGKTFTPKHRRHFFCSDDCRHASYLKPRRERKATFVIASCDFCGLPLSFPPWPSKIGDKVACDSCVGKMVRKAA